MTKPRGRPPLAWMSSDALLRLATGTAITLEGWRHGPRTTGRIANIEDTHLTLNTPAGEVIMAATAIKRGRTVDGLYEPGDPVLRRHVPADTWRGGVVRTRGTDVLVEQIGGDFAWFPEEELEPAAARDPAPAPLRRGPVPLERI